MQQSPVKLLGLPWLLALWLALAFPVTASAAADVINIRLGVHPDRTRVVLDLSAPAKYRIEPQTDPRQIVIALEDAGIHLTSGEPPAGHGLIKAIRLEPGSGTGGRLILDLAEPARVAQSQALLAEGSAPARIFVDLQPGGSDAIAAAINKNPVPDPAPTSLPAAAEEAKPKPPTPATTGPLMVANDAKADRMMATVLPVQIASTETVALPSGAEETAAAADWPLPPVKPDDSDIESEDLTGTQVAVVSVPGVDLPGKPVTGADARIPTIVLDPGHGGKDPGAIGAHGTMEKDVNLQMAKQLKALLEATGRYKVVLTRTDDRLLPLRQRIDVARAAKADLFISIHADHNERAELRGASVYTLSETASDAEAAAVAARENKDGVITGVDLTTQSPMVTSILIDLAQRETKNLSARFASLLTDELGEHTLVLRDSHRFAGFVVLKALDVPSVLLELGYLSNADDEAALGSKRHRRVVAKAIRDAIDQYFKWQRSVRQS
jgi:N-acetylmuramoyl-L-alanine amidase